MDYGIVKDRLQVLTQELGKGAGGPRRVGEDDWVGLHISREDGMKLKHLLASLPRNATPLPHSLPRSSHHFPKHCVSPPAQRVPPLPFDLQVSIACVGQQTTGTPISVVQVEGSRCSGERVNAFAWIRIRMLAVQPLCVCRMQVVDRQGIQEYS